jgi:hypothetical protein
LLPRYFRPTQRYYGNGYTVSYRYIPVYPSDIPHSGVVGESTNFRTDGYHLTPAQVDAFGAGYARLTKKDERSAAPRSAVTSIVRKKSGRASSKAVPDVPTELPAIAPAAPSAPPPAPVPAAVPDASTPAPAPASVPAPASAPAKP